MCIGLGTIVRSAKFLSLRLSTERSLTSMMKPRRPAKPFTSSSASSSDGSALLFSKCQRSGPRLTPVHELRWRSAHGTSDQHIPSFLRQWRIVVR
jgi:hypothetical protein